MLFKSVTSLTSYEKGVNGFHSLTESTDARFCREVFRFDAATSQNLSLFPSLNLRISATK